jgi:CRISPR-associated endonuclease Csn1
MRYRLGLDLGANSLGWCIVELAEKNTPIRLIRFGVRLFRDGRNPKDKQSLAVARRLARGMRRRRDRWLKRQRRFMRALIEHGLMPVDEAERKALTVLDPYAMRRDALDKALPPHYVGRALFHLNQRRGFKSNRKVDKADNQSGKITSALARVRDDLEVQGARTVGEWLASRHFHVEKNADGVEKAKPLAVRARLQGQGAKATYNLYLGRQMIADEFDAIWAAQSAFNPALFTAETGAELREILLHQRPLRPVKPGRCTLEPEDERAPLALPSSQRFRILQELNNLRYSVALGEDIPLTLEQRNQFADILEGRPGKNRTEKIDDKAKFTFIKMRRLLKLSDTTPFNLESDKRDGLKGNATSLALSKKDHFGDRWHELPLATQDAIVEKLLAEENESVVVAWLRKEFGLDETAALKIANAGLADSHSNLGRRALARVLPELQRAVITYDKAVVAAGYDSHSILHTGEIFTALPYYGIPLERHVGFGSGLPTDSEEKRYGRIANPTVHIGLNQLRRIVNAVIDRYGPPTQIALEVTRELKQSKDQKDRIQKDQAKRQEQNEADNAELRQLGLREFGENLLRMKLWRELNVHNPLDRRCPYTGRQISRTQLFSEEVEVEHILPFSKTLDDSIPNKTVAFRDANRYKIGRR